MRLGPFALRSTFPNSTLSFGETEELYSRRRFLPGLDPIPRREDDISLLTNTGIGNRPSIRPRCLSSCGCPAAILASTWAGCLAILPRTGAFACLRDLRKRFMPQCRSGRLSRSSREPSIPSGSCPCPMIEMAARTRKKWDWRDKTAPIWDSVDTGRHQQSMTLPSRPPRETLNHFQ